MKLEFSRKILEKSSNIKFHKNPSSVNRVAPCGQTHRHDETVAFRKSANMPKNEEHVLNDVLLLTHRNFCVSYIQIDLSKQRQKSCHILLAHPV